MRPVYLYIAANSKHSEMLYIGLSRDPIHRIQQHNRHPLYTPGAKCTKSGSPHWYRYAQIEVPEGKAIEFRTQCRKAKRKKENRIRHIILEATRLDYPIYAADPVNLLALVQRHRPSPIGEKSRNPA